MTKTKPRLNIRQKMRDVKFDDVMRVTQLDSDCYPVGTITSDNYVMPYCLTVYELYCGFDEDCARLLPMPW